MKHFAPQVMVYATLENVKRQIFIVYRRLMNVWISEQGRD